MGLLLAVLMLAGAALMWQRRSVPAARMASISMGMRTAKVLALSVEKTLRITGATSAENFVSLVTPQLRGSRSDRLRDTSGGSGGGSTSSTPSGSTPSGSTPSGSTSSSGSTSGRNASSSGGSSSSAASPSANGSSALQSATSRFGGTLRGSSAGLRPSASANTPATSSTMGASGVGSAMDSNNPTGGGGGGSGGGGAGGGGGSDFMLVLQKAAKPGAQVHKGDTIAEFDRQYMLLRLDDYKASVFQSEASLKKQKAALEITRKAHEQLITSAKGDLEKARLDLKTVPVLSAIDAERAKLALDQAEAKYKQLLNEVKFVEISQEADIKNAELDLAQAKLELKRAEANTDRMLVKAPIDGIVVMQNTFRGAEFGQIQVGDQLWPGMFFMQVVNPSSMVVNATVNQVDCEKIRVGSKARIHFDAYPDLALPGHVLSIAAVTKPGGQRANYVKEVPVRIKIDSMNLKVIPDLSVSAEIILDTEQKAEAAVPLGAVFHEGNLAKTFVLVQQPSGWERREIELGVSNHLLAAVRKGLQPGEVVALDGPHQAEEKIPGNL